MGRGNIMQRLTEGADLPMEPVAGLPVVEIAGENRILVENHGGITEYEQNSILVKVRYGHIRITGDELELFRMSAHQVVVRGKLFGVQIIRGR